MPPTEVISASFAQVSIFEVAEMERCGDDVADPAWAYGGVSQRFPAAGEEGEAAFALPARRFVRIRGVGGEDADAFGEDSGRQWLVRSRTRRPSSVTSSAPA
ncbi:hypothetical protein ACFOS3_33165 [Paractinoplanes deccanensis]